MNCIIILLKRFKYYYVRKTRDANNRVFVQLLSSGLRETYGLRIISLVGESIVFVFFSREGDILFLPYERQLSASEVNSNNYVYRIFVLAWFQTIVTTSVRSFKIRIKINVYIFWFEDTRVYIVYCYNIYIIITVYYFRKKIRK